MDQLDLLSSIPQEVRAALNALVDKLEALYGSASADVFAADLEVQRKLDDLNAAISRTAYQR